MSGSIEVYGDVMPGEGYEVDFDGGSATISGNTCSHSGGGDVPSVEMGDAETNNDNGSIGLTDDGNEPFISGSNLYITSQDNLTLAPGTCYFESLTFDS